MGTTLTGTTPQDTYDSLIKVTDNGPLSGTAKYLSDGLGNDSVLALSTARVGVGTSSPATTLDVAGTLRVSSATPTEEFYNTTNGDVWASIFGQASGTGSGASLVFSTKRDGNSATDKMTITQAGNVGIGTSSPNFILETAGTTGIGVRSTGVDGVYTDILSSIYSGNANEQNAIQASVSGNALESGFRFQVSDGSGLSTQTLGYQLNRDRHIFYTNGSERMRVTTNGLTFNGDTAAANALDDYEEGTFTPTFTPASGAYDTLTYGSTNGKYTKIGNRVDFSLRVTITAYSAGSASGLLQLGNLPFTCVAGYVGSVSMSLVDDFAANRYPIKGFINDTTNYILLRYMTALNTNEAYVSATDITASSTIRISGTYFTA